MCSSAVSRLAGGASSGEVDDDKGAEGEAEEVEEAEGAEGAEEYERKGV